MVSATYLATKPPLRERLAYQLRVLGVIASVEFKLKYADSALGYVWSLAKPLSYFGVLWVVFGRFFKTGIEEFPLYLFIGIVLYMYLVDAVGMTLPSIATRGSLLRRLAFPPLVIPISTTVTAGITFCVNLVAVIVFIAISRVAPRVDWLLVLPLLAELYVFVLGLGLIIATLFVRFRDVAQIWELASQLLLFASPIFYPVTVLPEWAQRVVTLNPFVQVIQDIRRVILGTNPDAASLIGGTEWRVLPIFAAFATLALGLWLYQRESPRFAERA